MEISNIFLQRTMSTISRKCGSCSCPFEINFGGDFIYCPRCGKLSSSKDNITWTEADKLRQEFGLIGR